MIIPSLADNDRLLESGEVQACLSRIERQLHNEELAKRLGLFVDQSIEGVLIALASIRLGLQVAFCHPRDPAEVQEAWFKELGVDRVYSSLPLPPDHYKTLGTYQISPNELSDHSLSLSSKSDAFMSILRTSGTGAQPKSACILGSAHKASARSVNDYFDFNEYSVWALPLPLAHVSGLSILFRALLSGGRIHVVRGHQELVRAFKSAKISHISLVPAQLKRLLHENIDCSALRALVVGGDRLMSSDRDEALKRGYPLYECYGMTETASMITVRKSSSGNLTVLPHATMRMSADNEILVRGHSLFSGYLSGGAMVLPLCPSGFFATGDKCAEADFNQLQCIWRKNNRIISGGENMQAEEIEEVLEEHPAIAWAVVLGLPDHAMGMRPCAYIQWKTVPLSLQHLQPFLQERLAPYKWPYHIFDWPHDLLMLNKKPRRILNERAQQEKR